MRVSPADIKYGIFWRNLRGEEQVIKGFPTRREAENATKEMSVTFIIHGYVQPASYR